MEEREQNAGNAGNHSARNFISYSNPLSKHPCPILILENQQLRFGKEAQEEGTGLWTQEEQTGIR